jgi:hypothetical protein
MSSYWFYHDAYWQPLSGPYRFLEAVGPVWQTVAGAQRTGTDMTNRQWKATVGVKGGRLDRRCFVWLGSQWANCDSTFH